MGKIALVSVGVNEYINGLLPLNFCVNDANLVFKSFSKYSTVYSSILTDKLATRDSILKALQDMVEKSRDDDYVLFSFAGHGVTIPNGQEVKAENSYICPHDFDLAYPDIYGIKFSELNKYISQLQARYVLIILDACHSGGALRRKGERGFRELSPSEMMQMVIPGRGRAILTACGHDEYAEEDDKLQHGVFSYYFVETLTRGGATEKYVGLDILYNDLKEKVQEKTNNRQTPQLKTDTEKFLVPLIIENYQPNDAPPDVDMALLPNPANTNPAFRVDASDLDKFKEGLSGLIEQNRFIAIDGLIKEWIGKLYSQLAENAISTDESNKEKVIAYYESCREIMKPLKILCFYLLEYYDGRRIEENLDYLFELESINSRKSGIVAVLQIPLVILSELSLFIIGLAYKIRSEKILKKFLSAIRWNEYGVRASIIYDERFYHPELFQRSSVDYLRYLFPSEQLTKDMVLRSQLKSIAEANFWYDSYSVLKERNTSAPIYFLLNVDITQDILVKVKDDEFMHFLERVFNVDKKSLVDAALHRQKELVRWQGVRSSLYQQIDRLIAELAQIRTSWG